MLHAMFRMSTGRYIGIPCERVHVCVCMCMSAVPVPINSHCSHLLPHN